MALMHIDGDLAVLWECPDCGDGNREYIGPRWFTDPPHQISVACTTHGCGFKGIVEIQEDST